MADKAVVMGFIKCNCNHCANHLEFDAVNAGEIITCPTCGMETTLYVPTAPPVLKAEKPAPFPAAPTPPPPKNKGPMLPWIVAAGFALSTLCLAGILISEHSGSGSKAPSIFAGILGKSKRAKQPDFPPPPPNRVEFTPKLLENFPERVDRQQGWMDGRFTGIDNGVIKIEMGEMYVEQSLAFGVMDNEVNIFSYWVPRRL